MSNIIFIASDSDENTRIDKYISEKMTELSRNYIQKLIKDEIVFVNGSPCKQNHLLKPGDKIEFEIPESIEPEIAAEEIDLDILYEDQDIIVINKPKGMVVHPAAGHYSGTLVNALMHHCTDLSGINGVLRPGIVHRIDKDTSGVIVACKNDNAHRSLAEQLKEHTITRKYNAITIGRFKENEGKIDKMIGRKPSDRKKMAVNTGSGKKAVTHYKVLQTLSDKYSYIECELETGRTHQIRVHMASIGHPILGDEVYGGKNASYKIDGKPLEGQTLHARVLGFDHPITGEYMEFEAPLPDYFIKLIDILSK